MRSTQVLSQEHRLITQVLNCLEKLVPGTGDEERLDTAGVEEALAFLKGFADRWHHAKEEAWLFPALEKRGFSPEAGPTAVMRAEHEEARSHVAEMGRLVKAWEGGDQGAVREFKACALGYIHLLREHIRKEDWCLFPMADDALDEKGDAALIEAFERVEREEFGAGVLDQYVSLANHLADRLGVDRESTDLGTPLP